MSTALVTVLSFFSGAAVGVWATWMAARRGYIRAGSTSQENQGLPK